ncbi:Uncharacterised protein [Bordetella pertussis]|nr:Uncharacterised protein [Bordetella pertussis]
MCLATSRETDRYFISTPMPSSGSLRIMSMALACTCTSFRPMSGCCCMNSVRTPVRPGHTPWSGV